MAQNSEINFSHLDLASFFLPLWPGFGPAPPYAHDDMRVFFFQDEFHCVAIGHRPSTKGHFSCAPLGSRGDPLCSTQSSFWAMSVTYWHQQWLDFLGLLVCFSFMLIVDSVSDQVSFLFWHTEVYTEARLWLAPCGGLLGYDCVLTSLSASKLFAFFLLFLIVIVLSYF